MDEKEIATLLQGVIGKTIADVEFAAGRLWSSTDKTISAIIFTDGTRLELTASGQIDDDTIWGEYADANWES